MLPAGRRADERLRCLPGGEPSEQSCFSWVASPPASLGQERGCGQCQLGSATEQDGEGLTEGPSSVRISPAVTPTRTRRGDAPREQLLEWPRLVFFDQDFADPLLRDERIGQGLPEPSLNGSCRGAAVVRLDVLLQTEVGVQPAPDRRRHDDGVVERSEVVKRPIVLGPRAIWRGGRVEPPPLLERHGANAAVEVSDLPLDRKPAVNVPSRARSRLLESEQDVGEPIVPAGHQHQALGPANQLDPGVHVPPCLPVARRGTRERILGRTGPGHRQVSGMGQPERDASQVARATSLELT